MERRSGLWMLLALLGLVLAAGVTAAASELSSQRVGLASEPLSAGDQLAPPTPARQRLAKKKSPARSNAPSTAPTSPTTTTSPPPVVTPSPVEPGDDHVGNSSGRGRDGDDD